MQVTRKFETHLRFAHSLPQDKQKIFSFIKDNEEEFVDILKKFGTTNLKKYLIDYLQEKNGEEKKENLVYAGMDSNQGRMMHPNQPMMPINFPPPPNFQGGI